MSEQLIMQIITNQFDSKTLYIRYFDLKKTFKNELHKISLKVIFMLQSTYTRK